MKLCNIFQSIFASYLNGPKSMKGSCVDYVELKSSRMNPKHFRKYLSLANPCDLLMKLNQSLTPILIKRS